VEREKKEADVRRLQSGDISRDRDVRQDQRDEVICIRVISGTVSLQGRDDYTLAIHLGENVENNEERGTMDDASTRADAV